MRLKLIDHVLDRGSGDKFNEDACGATALSAWVLDGATGLKDEDHGDGAKGLKDDPPLPKSNAAWLASTYSAELNDAVDRPDLDLHQVFAGLIAKVGAAFEERTRRADAKKFVKKFELPSAGMVFVRLRGATLEFARLGDCQAILLLGRGARPVTTGISPLQQLDAAVLKKMKQLRDADPKMKHKDLYRAVGDELRANRSRLNTEQGYWVLSTDPEAARHMEHGAVPLDGTGPLKGLLVSDGFYRLVDTFHLYGDDAELLEAASNGGTRLTAMLADLRRAEELDPECLHMRFKQKDDATALLFEVIE